MEGRNKKNIPRSQQLSSGIDSDGVNFHYSFLALSSLFHTLLAEF